MYSLMLSTVLTTVLSLLSMAAFAIDSRTDTSKAQGKLLVEDTQLPWQMDFANGRGKNAISRLEHGDVLVINGINPNAFPQLLVIRIDDLSSHDYYSRANLERLVNSGPFQLRISATGLKKENKQPLDIQHLTKMIIFNGKKKVPGVSSWDIEAIKIDSIRVQQDRALPNYIQAYDFGADDSEILEGSKGLGIINPYIQLFGQMREINRPGPDPWIRDGIAGIEEAKLAIEPGFYRLVLFREDIGEWENLPRQLNLSVAINGVRQASTKTENHTELSPAQWYQQEYLKFYPQVADQDPWHEIVRHRGLVQSFDFEQSDEELSIRLFGDSPQQRFISGLILQKLDEKVYQPETNGLNQVNARREEYFRQHWLIEDTTEQQPISMNNENITLAQGEGRLIEFDIALAADAKLQWQSDFQQQGGYIEVRKALPRWRRSGSNQHLTKAHRQLVQLKQDEVISGNHKLALWLQTEADMVPGRYELNLGFDPVNTSNEIQQGFTLSIQVLDQTLPDNAQKVGIYLDHSPHLSFFKEWQSLQLAQVYCDLNYLDRLGLRALSPPMETPTENNIQAWLHEIALYKEFYGKADLLAYTPYKRLKESLSGAVLQDKMAKLAQLSQGEMNIYWSIADEALVEQLGNIKQDAQSLHSANQFAKTAGHLNNQNQKSLIQELDLILMNHGFGVDKREIARITKTSSNKDNDRKRVWLYNMPNFRLAAGAFLWRSQADGYVQWHGRMPTANPYDPTDGREGDYQFFYPQPNSCADLPDVDKGLYELAMGQYELRWYLWLEQQAGDKAQGLKQEISDTLGDNWQQAEKITASQLDRWREQIIDLAQSLKHPDKSKQSGPNHEQVATSQGITSSSD